MKQVLQSIQRRQTSLIKKIRSVDVMPSAERNRRKGFGSREGTMNGRENAYDKNMSGVKRSAFSIPQLHHLHALSTQPYDHYIYTEKTQCPRPYRSRSMPLFTFPLPLLCFPAYYQDFSYNGHKESILENVCTCHLRNETGTEVERMRRVE